MSRVSIARTTASISMAVEHALELVGGMASFASPGDRALIKPNLNGDEGFTHPEVTAALVRLLREDGVRDIAIAESSFGSAAVTDRFFQATGYVDLAQRLGVELINLNRSEAVEVPVSKPLAVETVHIAKEILEADRIINVPNMKVHYATGITCALKNLKGCLVGAEKRRFHEVALEPAIADLSRVLRPALHVVDAVTCMEAMGPRGGDPVEMNLVLAGSEAAAVDCVAAELMGFRPEEVQHLTHFMGATGFRRQSIQVVGGSVADLQRPFRRAEVKAIVPERFTLHDGGACSACMGALLLSCSFLQTQPEGEVEVYLGRHAQQREGRNGLSITFGNCCPKDLPADLRLRGCPPYPFALGEALSKTGTATELPSKCPPWVEGAGRFGGCPRFAYTVSFASRMWATSR